MSVDYRLLMIDLFSYLGVALSILLLLLILGIAYFVQGRVLARFIRNQFKLRMVYAWVISIITLTGSYYLLWDYVRNTEWSRQDSCLDPGGCWDHIDKTCRKIEPNAQELCDR